MNQLEIKWDDKGISWYVGSIEFLRVNINSRMDYSGSRRRARNTAVEFKQHPFFSGYLSDNYKQMPWKEALEQLRNLGATPEEVSRFAHMGQLIGWGDIEEVMLHNGQSNFL